MITSGNSIMRLERWLSAVLSGLSAPTGSIKIALHQLSADDEPRLLEDFEVSEPPDQEGVRKIADKIDLEAREDAESLGWSSQRYRVDAREGRSNKQVGSIVLGYAGNTLTFDTTGPGDLGPSAQRGQLAFSMRQTDNAYRTLILGFGMAFDQMNRLNGRIETVMDKMTKSIERSYDVREEAFERRVEREALAAAEKEKAELARKQEEAKIERDRVLLQAGIDHLGPIIPILTNRFVGRDGATTPATSRDELMASLLGSMTLEQEQKLRSTLSDVQFAQLVELADSLEKLRPTSARTATATATAAAAAAGKTVVDQMKTREAQLVEAIDYFNGTLLPWAIARLQKGESVDPRTHSTEASRHFSLMLDSLAEIEFSALIGEGSPLGPGERKAFKLMAEATKKARAPEAVVTPDGVKG